MFMISTVLYSYCPEFCIIPNKPELFLILLELYNLSILSSLLSYLNRCYF